MGRALQHGGLERMQKVARPLTMPSAPERELRVGTPWDFATGGLGLGTAVRDDIPETIGLMSQPSGGLTHEKLEAAF